MHTNYIFVTGGVVSGFGKGINWLYGPIFNLRD